MPVKLSKRSIWGRAYPVVDIWMSRKSWPEIRVQILSAYPPATPYEITRCDTYLKDTYLNSAQVAIESDIIWTLFVCYMHKLEVFFAVF